MDSEGTPKGRRRYDGGKRWDTKRASEADRRGDGGTPTTSKGQRWDNEGTTENVCGGTPKEQGRSSEGTRKEQRGDNDGTANGRQMDNEGTERT
jgi:hypothetical protein